MRKLSMKAKAEGYDKILADRDIYSYALQCVIEGGPDAVERIKEDEHRSHEIRLYRANAPAGGVVVIIFRAPGQGPCVTEALLFERWIDGLRDRHGSEWHPWHEASGRLQTARRRLIDEKYPRAVQP